MLAAGINYMHIKFSSDSLSRFLSEHRQTDRHIQSHRCHWWCYLCIGYCSSSVKSKSPTNFNLWRRTNVSTVILTVATNIYIKTLLWRVNFTSMPTFMASVSAYCTLSHKCDHSYINNHNNIYKLEKNSFIQNMGANCMWLASKCTIQIQC